MDEIKKLYSGTINNTSVETLNLINGAIVKTILINNNGTEEATLTLTIDSVAFSMQVTPGFNIIDKTIFCKSLNIQTIGNINIHITGIELGGV